MEKPETYEQLVEIQNRKYERKAQERWDKEHLKTISTRMSVEEANAFRDACMTWGDTPYSYLKRHIRQNILGR